MEKWEYLSVYFEWREWKDGQEKFEDWVVSDDDDAPTGMTEILNHYGAQGWELVNLIPETAKGKLTHWASAEVKGFRVIFKRRAQS